MRTYELPDVLETSRPLLGRQRHERRKRPGILPQPSLDTAVPSRLARLASLTQQHRDLDAAISALCTAGASDPLQITRLKKRKLQLKDEIARIGD
jgi:hypothetical protein